MESKRGPLLLQVGLLVGAAALGYLVAAYVGLFDSSAGGRQGSVVALVASTVVVLAGVAALGWLHLRGAAARQQEAPVAAPSGLHETSRRYHSMFRDYPHSVYLLGLDGRFESLNLAAQDLSAHDGADLTGRHFTELVTPHLRETTEALFASAASGTPQQTRTAIRRTSGERVELSLRVGPVVVGSDIVGVYGVAEDITSVAAGAAHRASEERHRLVTEVTREVIWDADLLTGLTTWTGAVREVFDLPDDEVQIDLEWWRSRIHPEDVSRVIAAREAALASTCHHFLDEYRLLDHSGSYVTVLAQGRILRDLHGRATRFLGSMLDITELRRQEREVELARREAEEANNAKSLFLANMSHELRTPLSTVIAGAELVMDTPLTSTQQRLLERVSGAGERLLRLVDDLLDFSAIERGDVRMDEVPFLLATVVDHVAAWAQAACQDRHLDFQLASVDLPHPLLGDPDRIGQVLTNVLDNAVKFTSSGYVRLEVSATPEDAAGSDGVSVLFTVQDSGIGIEPAQREEIFKSFHQADPGITRRHGGNGLGLAISKELVESMGGSIGVESVPGHGSSFSVRVPFARSQTAVVGTEPA